MQARRRRPDQELRIPSQDEIPPRSGHVAACVDMKLLVWGGYQDENTYEDRYLPSNDLWCYSVDFDKWIRNTTHGTRPPGTSGACCCVLDSFFYVVFGHTDFGNTNKVYKLNLQTMTWSKLPAIERAPSPRDKFALWTYEKRIYCFGGFGVPIQEYLCENGDFVADTSGDFNVPRFFPDRGWNNQLLVLDSSNDEWSNPKCRGPVPLPRAAHGVAQLGDKVYLFGGRHLTARMNDLHCLDLSTLTWSGELTCSTVIPCGRSWHTLTPVSHNHVFLYGGYTQDQKPLSDAWVLDVDVCQWTQLVIPQNNPRLWHTTALSSGNDILIFGGCCDDILSHQVNEHSNKILAFRLQPKSLLRLCLETVFNYRIETQPSWPYLPSILKKWLDTKLKCSRTVQTVNQPQHNNKEQASTCEVT
ncbi:kelch domain-containing protein 2-like isoform X1 [Haliotis rufescens]|uniref:kelch domain-containing protein 2-like isoform X1 n=1 Tax=Haliotis rufescens TaxID=6454 RepID=UPI001EB0013A|nr:kelch domain-containing protein 2-like isoform X1 [Haliotis rufescens]